MEHDDQFLGYTLDFWKELKFDVEFPKNYLPGLRNVAKEVDVAWELANHKLQPHQRHNTETSTKVLPPENPWYKLSEEEKHHILNCLRYSFDEFDVLKAISKGITTLCPPIRNQPLGSVHEFTSSVFATAEAGDLHLPDFVLDTSATQPNWFENHDLAIERTRSGGLPSQISPPDSDVFKEYFLVASGAQGVSCVNLGKAGPGGSEKLVIYNSMAPTGQKFKVLPPLFMHPMVMHLRVDESGTYKVLVAGSSDNAPTGSDDPPFKTQEYSSTTGAWKCTGELPCPSFGLDTYQNGVYFTDSQRELLLCVGVFDMTLGTKGVLMYDFKKQQWVQGSLIPLVRGIEPLNIATMHIAGCGGSIFLSSKQECGQDVYFCIHKLIDLDSTADGTWEEIVVEKWSTSGPYSLAAELQVPQFACQLPCERLLAAPVQVKMIEGRKLLTPMYTWYTRTNAYLEAVLISECGFMFSTHQEEKHNVFIVIHKWKPSPDGSGPDGVWEEIYQSKRKRYRSPNWTAAEINVYLKIKEEGALGKVEGKDWGFISQQLVDQYKIIRSPKACEDLWGTLLKRHTDIENDLRSNNIRPDTSGWVNFWKMSGTERSENKLLRVFSLECYEMMDTILGIKPRKNKKPIMVDASSSSPIMTGSTLASDQIASLCDFYSGGNQNLTNENIAMAKEDVLQIEKLKLEIRAKELQIEIRAKELQIEILKNSKARDCANRRPRKARRLNA